MSLARTVSAVSLAGILVMASAIGVSAQSADADPISGPSQTVQDVSEAVAAASGFAISPRLQALLVEAEGWLLGGEMTPDDFPLRLRQLAPPERLLALAYVRRLGIYGGPALTTEALLAPADEADQE